jgi:hypothetical protein
LRSAAKISWQDNNTGVRPHQVHVHFFRSLARTYRFSL